MSSVSFVKALIFRKGSAFYDKVLTSATPSAAAMQVPCEGTSVQAVEYMNPVVVNGVLQGYAPTMQATLAATGSIKTIRVHNAPSNTTYWIAIGNSQTADNFTDMCNACCGTTPDLTSGVTIAAPVIEELTTKDSTGTAIPFVFGIAANPFGRNYLLTGVTYNGGTAPFTPTSGGYTSVANVVSALNSGASAMGTWSAINSNTQLKLVPLTGINSAGAAVDIKDGSFCLDIPSTAATVAVLTVKDAANADVNITIPTLTLSEANRAGVLAAIQQQLTGTLSLVDVGSGDWRLQYVGKQKPVALKSADLTTTSVSFAAGAC